MQVNNVMSNPPFHMTPQGLKALREELDYLKRTKRGEITQAISAAREHGDLKENGEYHAAREQQSLTEGRIAHLETRLSDANVIDITRIENTGKVVFGTTVTLSNTEDDTESRYKIVGEDEADVAKGKLSYTSPLGRALIGKEEGDLVRVETSISSTEYSIEIVEHIGDTDEVKDTAK